MGLLYIACVYILAYYSEANKGGRAKVRLIRWGGGGLAIFLRIFVSRRDFVYPGSPITKSLEKKNMFFFLLSAPCYSHAD
jgi:hypothetical protein